MHSKDKALSWVEKLVAMTKTSVPQEPPKAEVEVEGLVYPFVPVEEYICPNTGVFYTIGKLMVIHVISANLYRDMEAMLRLIQLCVRADGEELDSKQLYEMEMRTYKMLADRLMKQM